MSDLTNPTWIYDWTYKFFYQLILMLNAPLTSTSDIYWLYLLSALILAVWVAFRSTATGGNENVSFWRNFQSKYLSVKTWGHPSALLDMRYYAVNAILFPLVFAPLALQSQNVVDFLNNWAGELLQINSLDALGLSSGGEVIAKLIYTILFFIAYDAGRFIAHSLLHDIKWLWEFHKIHHSAEVLTPFTAFRVHPVDLLIMLSVPALTTGLITWIFHAAVSPQIGFYTLLNLHVFICLFNFIDNMRHWNVWLTYPAPLDKWFISPAHHQLHHSANPQHWGCNRGFELAIWDRLYKTIVTPTQHPQDLTLGLGDADELSWRSLTQLYLNPFKALFKSIRFKTIA